MVRAGGAGGVVVMVRAPVGRGGAGGGGDAQLTTPPRSAWILSAFHWRSMMMRLQKSLVAAALAFLWLGLTSPARAADFPKGTFTVKDPGGTVWAVNFDGKGKFTVTRADKDAVEGTYKVNKD